MDKPDDNLIFFPLYIELIIFSLDAQRIFLSLESGSFVRIHLGAGHFLIQFFDSRKLYYI